VKRSLLDDLRRASPDDVKRALRAMTHTQRELVRAQFERLSFSEFVRAAWPIIDARPLVWNWHLEAMCLHLQLLAEGRIDKLAINIPPGAAKSMICTILWPCWRWASRPSWQVICASYESGLATEHSIKRRQLLESEWYRQRHARTWSLREDQNAKDDYKNTVNGHMTSIGVGGAGTGRRADCIVLDDPLNAKAAHSKADRDSAIRFQDAVAITRFNDMTRPEMVLVMQRLHEEDSTGHALEQGGWCHLRIPAEFEPEARCVTYDVTGKEIWRDPRTEDGELFFVEKFPRKTLDDLRERMGDDFWGQYQQRPTAAGGGLFEIANWRFWKPDGSAPEHQHPRPRGCYDGPANPIDFDDLEEVLISVDATFRKTKAGSYVAIHVWGKLSARRLLLDRVHERMDFHDTVQALRRVITDWPQARRKLIEGKANGDAIISSLTREHGITCIEPVDPGDQSKEQRARAAQPYQKAGNVELPDGAPWLGEYIAEHAAFPKGRHNDDVDAQGQALLGFEQGRGGAFLYDDLEL